MGHKHIRAITYQPPPGIPLPGIEVVRLRDLRRKVSATELVGPQCPQFHLLALVTAGSGRHSIDFTDHPLRPGVAWWTRPGQVQQWGDVRGYEATIVLFESGVLDATAAAMFTSNHVRRASSWDLHTEAGSSCVGLFNHLDQLSRTHTATPSTPHQVGAIMTHTLTALLLSLESLTQPGEPTSEQSAGTLLGAFEQAVERHYRHTRAVTDYAGMLGYSEKTLTRAVRGATGLTAKQYVDGRVTLEAKRLLAHSALSTARIASELGFDDASNFAKFFAARTGTSPGAFRSGTATAQATTPAAPTSETP